MVDEKILNYVKENVKKGYTLDEIKKGLLDQKLPRDTVNDVIEVVSQFEEDLKPKKRIFSRKHKEEKPKKEEPKKPEKIKKEKVKPAKKEKPMRVKPPKKVKPVKQPKPKKVKPEKVRPMASPGLQRSRFAPPLKKKRKLPYAVKIFLSVVFVIVLIFIFLFLLINNSKPPVSYITISEYKVAEGVSFNVVQDSEVNFTLNNWDYQMKIKEVSKEEGYVKIEGFADQTLWEGKTRHFNLDDDMQTDLILGIDDIDEDGIVTMYIKEDNDFVCPENWNCTNWSECINGFQQRFCVDLNSCGTIQGKPVTEKTCTAGAETYYAVKGNGTAELHQIFDCGIESFDLVNDCLINYATDCTKSKLQGSMESNFEGRIVTETKYFEIKGLNDYNKCLFYQKDLALSVYFNDSLIQDWLDKNYTMEEIQTKEYEENVSLQEYVGLWFECAFDSEVLNSVLEEWKVGNFSSIAYCDVNNSVAVNCTSYGEFINTDCNFGYDA